VSLLSRNGGSIFFCECCIANNNNSELELATQSTISRIDLAYVLVVLERLDALAKCHERGVDIACLKSTCTNSIGLVASLTAGEIDNCETTDS
jgi:hypothetical protein